MALYEARLQVHVDPVDFSHPRWAIHMDGYLKAKSRARCKADYLWQTDTDEVVVAHDFERIRLMPQILGEAMQERPVVFMPMVEFWGSLQYMRADFLSWKPRFSRNDARITHGVPLEHRMVDRHGYEYPRPFESDSCNYIWKDSHESVPMIIPMSIPKAEMNAQEFAAFFDDALNRFPSVLHISWLDLKRKLNHYRQFWPQFHASMYNLDEPDTPKKNVMFNKRWSEVNDADIEEKVRELIERGPYFFGAKNARRERGAVIPYRGVIPEALRAWVEANRA